MPIDPLSATSDSTISPATICFEIVPSSVDNLPNVTKAIYVGVGGDLTLRTLGSDAVVTFRNVPSGALLPIRIVGVRTEGTTASSIMGLA